jgi:hypothetical protein
MKPELAMRLKSTLPTFGPIFFWAMSLSLPLSSAGCGQTACFTWSGDEGDCPLQSKALPFFQDPACPGSVASVDSDGDFANNLCCYTVTKQDSGRGDDTIPCAAVPPGFDGVGGAGTSGIAVSTGGSVSPPPSCLQCAQALASDAEPFDVCAQSKTPLQSVTSCMCNGLCKSSCEASFCKDDEADSACLSCLGDTATGCGAEFDKCVNDS